MTDYIPREAALRDWPFCDEPADAYFEDPSEDEYPKALNWLKEEASDERETVSAPGEED
jgi:hypothetical protein